jgi:putative Holliday junction resolvase
MSKVIAIDYGLARMGLAISDASRTIAFPIEAISGGDAKTAVKNLLQALESRLGEVDQFVVGLPLHLDGNEGTMAVQAKRFARELEEILGKPVQLWDERLSTCHAEKCLKEGNLTRKKRSKKVDSVAATILLQSYLDTHDTHCAPVLD